MKTYQDIERSIITKFRKEIWSKFIKAIIEYKLIEENDNIMVCISGGKDSFLLAKLIQEVQLHGKHNFKAHYVVMDPGYKIKNRKLIEENARLLNIPINIYESDIFEVVDKNFQDNKKNKTNANSNVNSNSKNENKDLISEENSKK